MEREKRGGKARGSRERVDGSGPYPHPNSTFPVWGDTQRLFHAQSMEKGWISQRKLNLCSENCLTLPPWDAGKS